MNPFYDGPQGMALKKIAETLWSHHFEVLLAGGCVRDWLLGRPYKDVDVVTDASVEDLQNLFEKTVPVGVQFGIVRVLLHGFEFEVARFRTDGPYRDGRHPEFVHFAGPFEDAHRRDFTVNALFYDLKKQQILDFVHGQRDLQLKLLKTVGDPFQRFSEDYLRIVRLVRFACQLNFTVDLETAAAAQQCAKNLPSVSGERLGSEIIKALSAQPREALKWFLSWELPHILFPQWAMDRDVLERSAWILGPSEEAAWALAHWFLNFQTELCLKSITVSSETGWDFSADYLVKIEDFTQRLSLSKELSRRLKEVSSVLAWPSIWSHFRLGYRGMIAQAPWFHFVFEAGKTLHLWASHQLLEIQSWKDRALILPFLSGKDVVFLPPVQRGLVLRESLYLQYEGILLSREQALAWLKLKQEG